MRRTTRARRALLVVLAAFAGSLLFASPAGAVEETIGSCLEHEVEEMEAELEGVTEGSPEYVEIREEFEERFERCQDAPNPLLPEINELIWGAVGFFVVLGMIYFFGYPAIKQAMANRAERIQNDLAAAEAQRGEAETILSDYRAQLSDARNESARIIEEARQQADTLKRDQEARLQAELAEMRERATADIETAKAQAIADLRGEVAALAVGAAEVVVKRNLDQQSQVQLIEDYINQVTTQNG
jgi:F-type H+-transporting ATPase subunit b